MSLAVLAGVVAFGALTGMLSGLLGVGGGILMVPFLVVAVGLDQQHAQATSLLVIAPTAVVASYSLRRRGVGDLPLGLRMGVVGIAGSVAGTLIALALPERILGPLFAAVMAFAGVRLLREARIRDESG